MTMHIVKCGEPDVNHSPQILFLVNGSFQPRAVPVKHCRVNSVFGPKDLDETGGFGTMCRKTQVSGKEPSGVGGIGGSIVWNQDLVCGLGPNRARDQSVRGNII